MYNALNFNNNDYSELFSDSMSFKNSKKFRKKPVAEEIYPEQENRITLSQIVKICFSLGIKNFGTLNQKENRFKKFFIEKERLITEELYDNIYNFSSILPGNTRIQILLNLIFFKNYSVLRTLLGIIIFILPGLLMMLLISFVIDYFTFDYMNDYKFSPFYIRLLFYTQNALGKCGLILLLDFVKEEIIKIKSSNFHSGLMLISLVVTLFANNVFSVVILFIISGFLCIKNQNYEMFYEENLYKLRLPEKKFETSILGLPSLILFVCMLVIFLIFFIFNHFDLNGYSFFSFISYIIGCLVFKDYAIFEIFYIFFKSKITVKDIMISFGLMNVLPGCSLNFSCGAFFKIDGVNFIENLFYTFLIYLPGILLNFFFVRILPLCNKHPQILFFFNGVKISSLGLIIGFIPRLWYYTCYDKTDLHWCIETSIVLIGFFFFYKQRVLLGFLTPFVLEIIISFI